VPLHVYQAIWGMQQLPWKSDKKWTLDEQLDLIVAAGYDGLSLSFSDAEAAKAICAEATARGLRIEATCFPTTVDELTPVLETIEAVGRKHVDHVNLQPNVRLTSLGECIPYILGWQASADDAGVPMYVETHRDRMTTDLLFTVQLIDAVPTLQLTADLSHFLVGREFAIPVGDEEEELIRRVLSRARAYHGRIASREQVQVQIAFPHHKVWVDLFSEWWREGFRRFRATAGEGEILTFTTELGPPFWYAITGPDGEELSDRWAEALQLASIARSLWDSAGS
jgi:sugar phosphate isomerase/epimerase